MRTRRMTTRLWLCALFAVCCAGCATSEPPMTVAAVSDGGAAADTAAPAEGAGGSAASEEICRLEPVLGSRFKRRICATAAQWEAIETSTQQQMDMMRRGSGAASACSGNSCR